MIGRLFWTFYGNAFSMCNLIVADGRSDFSEWVKDNEPGVLTYSIFTRPKAPAEVFLFGRYKDQKAMEDHGAAPEHQEVVKHMMAQLDTSAPQPTTLWQEVEDSFVSNAFGGASQTDAKI
ncbi:hypothetical protein LTR09_001145 [Extremus antarcticus]|uniref:ABM domain-containing protein n=1 Tax=Extremus antarcticus TaxID=702011 RepID=A0AAJ0GIB6_9PEZI|nr:hypothetical protein LTR09_001145 [Extremus antarcticus]